MAKSKDQENISRKQLAGWGIPIVIAIVGGTFSFTKYMSQKQIDTLKTSLEHKNQLFIERDNKVKELQAKNSSQKVQTLPPITSEDAESVQKLADRISELEKERIQLTQELTQKAINSLDPESELPILLRQLSSEHEKERMTALVGLFALEDPRSFSPLATYFTQNLEEATGSKSPYSRYQFHDLLFKLNPQSTLQLLVDTLDSKDESASRLAYRSLNNYVESIELIDTCKPYLESLAFRSTNSSARARAKVMLSKLSEKRAELVEKEKKQRDERTEKEILLDLEEFIHTVNPSEPNQIEPAVEPNHGDN